MTTLLDSLGDYMVLTLKKNGYIRSQIMIHGTINELKYTISAQRVVVAHNATHLLAWSVNLILLQI
jgi:hypothetical protein